MKVPDTAIPFVLAVLLLLAAQVAGLLGFVAAMRWCWLGAVLLGGLTWWVDTRNGRP